MKMLTDWNCHLLPMMGEWITAPKDTRDALLLLNARTGIRRFCMMAEFDCGKDSLPGFLIARDLDITPETAEFYSIDVSAVGLDRLRAVTQDDIYQFLFYVGTTRGNHWSARARKLASIRSLYKYLVSKRHYLTENPTVDIDSPKAQKTLPKVLSLDEALRLLEAVRTDTDAPNHVRDYAILTLFLNCGMRVSELAGINLTDLEDDLRSLRVTGKGSKERVIYLNDACRSALSDYLKIRKSDRYRAVTDKALFLSQRDVRISVKMLQAMVYRYLKRAGLGSKHYSVHKLRHTAATLMYQSGNVDVRVLKDILGHEQLNTTQIYTHVSNREMEEAMSQNPLAGLTASKK